MAEPKNTVRVSLRLDEDTHERLKYWSARKQVSLNTYILDAIDLMIAYENGDYDVPTALIQRINQLTGTVMAVQSSMDNLTNVTINGFDAIVGLARGDNYLAQEEDGELDEGTDLDG
jgi:predicted DNA-binding protein